MNERTCTELVVRSVSELRHSPNGHPYVECRADGGLVAVWGSPGKMDHIDAVTGTQRPFRIVCDCIPSKWRQHDLWVYERHDVYLIEPVDDGGALRQSPVITEAAVSLDDLSAWRRQIVAWVVALEGGRSGSTDGVAGRIGALSFAGAIPREIAALMRAVTEMRNAAEYDAKRLSKVESLAVRNAWLAITEWAAARSL